MGDIAYYLIALSAHTTQAFLAPFAYFQRMDLLEQGNLLPLTGTHVQASSPVM
jgi:hypothetical protein